MKKFAIGLMATCLSLTLLPFQLNAAVTGEPSSVVGTKPPEPVESVEIKALLRRVEGINDVDKTKLISPDKKNSQVEIRNTGRHHRNDRNNGGVVYISAGALVLIIILVVILL